jgi:putative ABC transport system permease protein
MSLEILENLKMALSSLMANKLRSGLTMLGIAIGNASVIAMVGVGQGAQKLAAEQFQSLGPNVLFVSLSTRRMRRNISGTKPLVLADAQAIAANVPTVKAVAPEIHSRQVINYRDKTTTTPVIGVTPDYLQVRNFAIAQGRFINETDLRRNNRVVVLGSGLAKQLFIQENPVGEQLRLQNITFEVIGVMAAKGSLFGGNLDDQGFVPLTTMSNQLIGRTSIYGIELSLISVLAKNQQSVEGAEFQIKNLLQLRHPSRLQNHVLVLAQKSVMDLATQTNEGLTRMLAAIASISLLVGGIGVMNIMLVSVTERTQEIGLRKAVGARENDILVQFLIEAVLLATTGGLIGVLVGVGVMVVAGSLSLLTTSISPVAIVASLTVSGSIGLFFGVFPARRAAKLDPIIALRSN